jgi:hypothetical protein
MMKSPKAPESASCCPLAAGVADVAADVCLDSFRWWALLVGDFASVTAAEFDNDCRCGEESVSLTVGDDVVMSREAWKRSRL